MSQFNSTTDKKYDRARNDINSRMQGFMTPNYNTSQGQSSGQNKQYKNDNLLGNTQQEISTDRSDFKNDINSRMDTFNRMNNLGQRQLPFHNNIRDYTITMDSKKDEFNDRLSNYNHLSTNITPNANQTNKFNNMSFHKNFKEDTNKRLEELSPLSRNLGIPFNGNEMPKKPDFGSNIQENNINDKFTNHNYQEQFKNKEDDDREKEIYIKNYQSLSNNTIPDNISYNNYDNFSYSSFEPDTSNLNRNQENLKKIKNQESIKDFDYSIMDNSAITNFSNKNNQKRNDGINNVPELSVYTSMPVDTRQEFHFQN